MTTSQVEIACRIGDVFDASDGTKQHLVAIAASRGVPAGALAELQRITGRDVPRAAHPVAASAELPHGA